MIERNIAYEASAGSGKTFMLVVRYLSLLFLGSSASKILTLTFTNKAANEMSERIIHALEELEDRDELAVICEQTGLSKTQILKQRPQVLESFLQSHTKIMTIDSFFAQILRKFSLYVGVMPDFNTTASVDKEKLLERFLLEVEVKREKNDLVHLYRESKKRLFELFFLLEEFFVKTQELERFSFAFIPTQSLEQQALEILSQMNTLIQKCDKPSKHALNAFVVEHFSDILDKSWFGRESLEYRTFSKCYTPELDRLLHELYSVMQEWFVAKEQSFFYTLKKLSLTYNQAKLALFKQTNTLSFSDITLFVYELLEKKIDKEFLYFRLDSTIEHILLDEFQDTSIMQYAILEPLISEALSGSGVHEQGSFFFVGDKKQSIYRFRGGVSALFDEVARRHHTEVKKLLTNYRSQKAVVEFVNDVFREKIKGYSDQKVLPSKQGGYVAVVSEADIVAACVAKVELLLSKGASAQEIAILCTTNADGKILEAALQEKKIAVVTETTAALIHQEEIEALFEYLKYLYFKEDLYKENFFALIGKKVKIDFVDFNTVDLLHLIKNAIEKFSLFSLELNYFQFIEILQNYPTIEALLFGYEQIESEALSLRQEGVKIVTIHKSKGLEYEHVIVLDRLSNPPADRSTIVYDYNGISLEGIYLRIKNRAKIDTAYAAALAQNQKLSYEDMLNNYYVAFTRAKRNLFIIKKEQKSAFESLDLEVHSRGVLEVVESKEKDNDDALAMMEYESLYFGSQNNILEVARVSQKEEYQNQQFGLAVHYLLEMAQDFSEVALKEAFNIVVNRYGGVLEQEDLETVLARAKQIIHYQPFQNLLQGATLLKEQPLKYKNKLYIIDLLIQQQEENIIVDYKTGKTHHMEYQQQLRSYITAVEFLTKKKTRGFLCYTLEGGVELEEIFL